MRSQNERGRYVRAMAGLCAGVVALAISPGVGLGQDTQIAELRGVAVEYVLTRSSGPSIVIVPGGFQDWRPWAEVIDRLSSHYSVLSFSGPGIGQSGIRREASDPSQTVRLIRELLEAVDLAPPYILVGHSNGGLLVRGFVAAYPDLVRGRLYVDPSVEGMMVRFDEVEPGYSARQWKEFFAPLEGTEQQAFFERAKAFWDLGVGERSLVQGKVEPELPTVVLSSARVRDPADDLVETRAGRRAWVELHRKLLPALGWSMHVVLPEVGHNLFEERPDLIVDSVRWLIDASAGPGGL
jgi:pimeloyl-ACP methyl ester carboxylesterase